mmetsp:Transcript_28371/g.51816  ORF Transcript_28371/g.51816 Transcript_28371/m.51816 type:complete len:733 (+) Transcript_28371:106-2304(+)|eukprot:CAMPEP_0196139644 /NCGR_PEP_ID=MMETSP0910-20130528/6845_1 /TAXON_ID=49265 /ORGANISM="Thalassiosira rotula, Strain GSO102" /LENGTH=732 /DNA_ID=CAMNT_0041400393 /DNA_START=73 /DNA_END=2271 /DNA_ORIENTATION=+
MATASSSSPPLVLNTVSIIAAGCILLSLLLVSTKIIKSPSSSHEQQQHYHGYLRPESPTATANNRHGRRLLGLGFNDPKTVEYRPGVTPQSDATVTNIGRPNPVGGIPSSGIGIVTSGGHPIEGGELQQGQDNYDGPPQQQQPQQGFLPPQPQGNGGSLQQQPQLGTPVVASFVGGGVLNPYAQGGIVSSGGSPLLQGVGPPPQQLEQVLDVNSIQNEMAGGFTDDEVEAVTGIPPIDPNNSVADSNEVVPIPQYNINNALATTQSFRYTLFFFIYDSKTDKFVIVHNIPGCDHGCLRIFRIASAIGVALRKNFPNWFAKGAPDQKDFVVMMSCGDSPRVKRECYQHQCGDTGGYGPILQFGSVFVDPGYFPSMIAMPLPVRPHMPCFEEWQLTEGANGACQDLKPKTDFTVDNGIKGGMVFGQELGMLDDPDYWDKLIPQLIWRGTDFVFLHSMFPEMRTPVYEMDIAPHLDTLPTDGSPEDDKRWAIKTLWGMGDEYLLPRWRGVLLTSEAELEATDYSATVGEPTLPWVNIKFASINVDGEKESLADNEEYTRFAKLGIACIGERVNMIEQARFKYHIDLGGGGGTTWTGTVEKLALPGVLFHHQTPTKDWFHDLLVPWEHYIPVETDLSDLREKFEWAESHPAETKRIAEAGTMFARWMGSDEGFALLYENHMVAPLRRVLEAYTEMPPRYAGKSVLEAVLEHGKQRGFTIIGRCSGMSSNDCANTAK